jgi:hypothetical protein
MWWLLFAVSKMIVLNVEKSGTEEAFQTCALMSVDLEVPDWELGSSLWVIRPDIGRYPTPWPFQNDSFPHARGTPLTELLLLRLPS